MTDDEFKAFAAAHPDAFAPAPAQPTNEDLSRMVREAVEASSYHALADRAIDPETGGTVSKSYLHKLATNAVTTAPTVERLRALAVGLGQPLDAVQRAATNQWIGGNNQRETAASDEPEIPADAAGHVLWHAGHGGYEPNDFISRVLTAWDIADDAGHTRLSVAFPGYGAALQLLHRPGGVDRLRALANPS